ncbi:efflux RND transporter periplasmic adaptor subunit [Hellea sp.]|nr:efflux RND transporter periplasmic adaptor subunit [Hellea sp.]
MKAPVSPTPRQTHLSALQTLLAIEGDALSAPDLMSLRHIAVNRPRELIDIGHVFWVSRRGKSLSLSAMSSQPTLNTTTPFAQWMRRQLRLRLGPPNSDEVVMWTLDDSQGEVPFTYPFTQGCYAPFSPVPRMGGLVFTRKREFTDAEIPLIDRMAQIFGVSALALGRKARPRISLSKRASLWAAIGFMALAACIPVPMTSLAPAEIVADTPYMVTAPFDGVIYAMLVPPGMAVTQGTPLLRFVDTAYRNELNLAKQEKSVAEAKLRHASLSAFMDDIAKRDMVVAQAEKALAQARQNYASERLSKTTLYAAQSGLALYSDPSDWTGRHVSTGEAIIEIANPSSVRLRLDVPLSLGESLHAGARIKLFLDNSPLRSFEAELTSAGYYPQTLPNGHMAYEAYGRLNVDDGRPLPRIGTRGVAKIYGRTVPLGYWVFRRPLTMIRQSMGA